MRATQVGRIQQPGRSKKHPRIVAIEASGQLAEQRYLKQIAALGISEKTETKVAKEIAI